MLYDGLLVLAIVMAGTAAAIGVRVWLSGADAAVADPNTAAHGPLLQLWLLLLVVSFFTLFWRWKGQTLGMQAWRLKIRNADGSRLSVAQCLLRLLAGLLSWCCLGFGYWVIFFNPGKGSWSDSWSKSECVVLPKKS